MALDDRERNFEKALARELRANGISGLECPDAETLAAYHERMLSPEEMAAKKTHIAACPRCQEILATLEVTEAIPSAAEDSEKLVEQRTAAVPASVKSATVRVMPKPKTYLRWVVPAGAIAAGLLVWVVVSSNRPATMMTKQSPVQVAENRESTNAQLVAPKQLPAEAPGEKASAATMADQEFGKAKEELDAIKPTDPARAMTRRKTSGTPTYDHGPRAMQNQAQNQVQNQMQNQVQNNGQLTSRNEATELKRADEVPLTGRDTSTLAQNAPRQEAQARKSASAPAPPAATEAAGAGASAGLSKDEPVRSMSQVVTVEGQADAIPSAQKEDDDKSAALKKMNEAPILGGLMTANLRDAKAGTPGFVGTPDPKVFWFFTTNGMVLRSEDAGKTTKLQKTRDGIKFIGGSAPDAKTCWLLAEKGIVLRTSNGGKKWTSAATPTNGNFTMITAIDAMHALITDESARVSYSTTNGGATWTVVARP